MKKLLKEYDVKIVDATGAFDKEDYEQLIGHAVDLSLVEVQHGDVIGTLVDVDEELFAQIVQKNEETGNFELNVAGLKQFVKVVGADTVFLADKGYINEVSGKGLPVPAFIHPTIET